MDDLRNFISYYCDGTLHAFYTDLAFEKSTNIGIDVYFRVKEHSESLGVNGKRHDIMFADVTCGKCMTMPHMWPLEKYPIILLSDDEVKRIKSSINLI